MSIRMIQFIAFALFLIRGVDPALAQSTSSWTLQQAVSPKKIGDVSAPVLIHAEPLKFNDGRTDVRGVIALKVIVEKDGIPSNPKVVRGLGMGLDEAAIKVVLLYRFKPAMKRGRPIALPLIIEVCVDTYGDSCEEKKRQINR